MLYTAGPAGGPKSACTGHHQPPHRSGHTAARLHLHLYRDCGDLNERRNKITTSLCWRSSDSPWRGRGWERTERMEEDRGAMDQIININITPTSHQHHINITPTSHQHHTNITSTSHQHHPNIPSLIFFFVRPSEVRRLRRCPT